MSKDINTIKNELISSLLTNEPNADVQDGSLIRDINIDPQSLQFSYLYEENDYVKSLTAWKKNAENIENIDLDNIAENADITRKPATFATSIITFRAKQLPQQKVRIGNEDGTGGINVKSMNLEDETYYQFSTTETVFLDVDTKFNESSGFYEVSAPIRATLAGPDSNVGVGTLIILETPITGVDSIYNYVAATGGNPEQNNAQMAEDMVTAIKGSTKNTENGIKDVLNKLDNISEIKIFNPNSEEATESGIVYAFLKTDSETSFQDIINYSSINNQYKLLKRPVKRIISVKAYINGVLTTLNENLDYYLFKDEESIYSYSINSNDAIVFANNIKIDNNSNVIVDYIYYSKIKEAQDLILQSENDILLLGNVITKIAQPILIDIELELKLKFGFNSESNKNNIITGLQTYINNLKMGEDLTSNQVFTYLIQNFDYIETINYPFKKFEKRGESNQEKLEAVYGQYLTIDENSIIINFN